MVDSDPLEKENPHLFLIKLKILMHFGLDSLATLL